MIVRIRPRAARGRSERGGGRSQRVNRRFHRYRLQHTALAFGARLSHSGGIRTEAFKQTTDGKGCVA